MQTDTHCVICNTELPVRTTPEGRPRLYCSKDCTNKGYQARRTARRAAVRATYACVTCGKPFVPPKGNQRSCSKHCWLVSRGLALAEPHPNRVCALPECDKLFTPKRHLDRCCSRAHGRRLTDVECGGKRRAIKVATATGRVRLDDIIRRDMNRCHICGEKVGDQPYPHPKSRSLDHVIPLSKGGSHTQDNIKLSHLSCNVAKGNRGGNEQLLLIG